MGDFKLYELNEIYNNIWDLVSDDEIDVDTLEKALTDVEDNINSKADNIAKLIKGIDIDVVGLKAEEKRIADRRKALENKQSNIKLYLENQLKMMEIDKLKTTLFSFNIQNNPPSVKFINEDLIPQEYKTVVTTTSISKKDILAAIKEGIEVEGAEMVQTRSIRIR